MKKTSKPKKKTVPPKKSKKAAQTTEWNPSHLPMPPNSPDSYSTQHSTEDKAVTLKAGLIWENSIEISFDVPHYT